MCIVNQTEYPWNPFTVRAALGDSAPKMAAIVLHALCDAMWMSDTPSQIVSPAASVRALLGIGQEEYRESILALMNAGLLESSYDLGGRLVWRAPALVAAEARLYEADREADKMRSIRRAKEESVARRLSLRARVGAAPPNPVPSILYLKISERSVLGFDGWLPAARFDRNGQAVPVRESEIELLSKKHPGKNIREVLSRMFEELMQRPLRRPSPARMAETIDRWMEGDLRAQKTETNINKISDALEELPDFESIL